MSEQREASWNTVANGISMGIVILSILLGFGGCIRLISAGSAEEIRASKGAKP